MCPLHDLPCAVTKVRPELDISEQVVLVTGGARGLGRHIVESFAGQGARIVVNYRQSQQAAKDLAAVYGPEYALTVRSDVTDPSRSAPCSKLHMIASVPRSPRW